MKKPPRIASDLVRGLYRDDSDTVARGPEDVLRDHLFFAVSKHGLQGWAHLAACLFFAIARHHDEATARRIFSESGPPPKRLIAALRNATVLDRLDAMKPKPNIARLSRELAEENRELPKDKRRGAGGTDVLNLKDHIRDLVRARKAHRQKLGVLKTKIPRGS
jgi:hypothetical protein